MKYKTGQQVTILQNRNYPNGDQISAGTSGTILMEYSMSKSYSVMFSRAKMAHRIAEQFLQSK